MNAATVSVILDEVGVRRRGRIILRGVSMRCERGSVTVIRGANGAGKSTLLGVATGLVKPSRGTVVSRNLTTSYLSERFSPPSAMDVRSYMKWIAGTRGVPRRARDKEIAASLESLGFAGSMGPMRLLSKGNLQRVGLASALIGSPELIVLDEPFSGIDSAGEELVARAIGEASAAGSTMLLVHHGKTTVQASQSLWLEEGTLHNASRPSARFDIHAATNANVPDLPQTATATPASHGHVVISTDSSTLEPTLLAIFAAGWTVHGMEQR